MRPRRSRNRARKVAAAILVASPACLPSVVEAIARTWLSNNGNWSTPGNWSGGAIPIAGDDAIIANNDLVNRIITFNVGSISLVSLQLNNNGGVSNILSQGGNRLDANIEQVGTTGRAFYSLTGGSNNLVSSSAGQGLFVGVSPGSSGSYSISGSAQLTTTANGAGTGEIVGFLGAGTFFHSNGTNTLTGNQGNLVLGAGSTGFGFYSFSGGTLNCLQAEIVGNSGTGGFNHLAGSNTASFFVIGANATGVGTYAMTSSSATLATTTGFQIIGGSGVGTFTQQGGNNTAGRGMDIGSGTGSTGVYNLSGGSLTVDDGSFLIGNNGTGSFLHSGGTLILGAVSSSDLTVGAGTNGVGNYVLNGPGVIQANSAIRVGDGGTGTFNQSAGTVSSLSMTLGNSGSNGGAGTYLLSSGAVLNSGTNGLIVNAGGSFIQSGGLHKAGSPLIANAASISTGCDIESGGYYRLSGGTLDVNGLDGVGGGSFEQVGGLHLVHGITLILANFNGTPSTYFLSGGTFQQVALNGILGGSTSTFSVLPGGALVGGNGFLIADAHLSGGTVSGMLQNQGTFSFETGTFSAQLQNEGTFKLNGNAITAAGTTNNLDLGVFNGPGIITGAFTNRGIATAGGTLSTGTLMNFGLINIGTNSAMIPSNGVNNNGGVIEMSRGVLGGAGSLINIGMISGGGTISLALTLTGGTILANDPTAPMNITGSLNINFPTGALVVAPGCNMRISNSFSNIATITLQGAGALLSGNAVITNGGIISGPGQINNTISNGGTIRTATGELILAGAGNLNNSNGTISATNGATISFSQGLATNVGTILLTSGALNINSAVSNVGTISGRGSISAGTITSNGTITLSGGTTDFFAPLVNTNRASVTGNALVTFYAPVDTSVGTLTVNLGSTAVFLGAVTGVGHIAGAGVKDFEGPASGPIATLTGTTIVGFDGDLSAASIRDNTLSLVGEARITPNGSAAAFSRLNSLIIDGTTNNWSGKLDLNDNDLIVDYTGASPIQTIANQIKSGFAAGSWNGNGITSTSAAGAGAVRPTALGYLEASAISATIFDGQSVDDTSILIRYVFSGDANLDSFVNALDFNALASNFGGGGKLWVQADFNYDGNTNTLDFNAIAANFNLTLPSPPALSAMLPEPVGAVAAGAIAFAARRRRSRK